MVTRKKPYLIAEVGVNYYDTAKQMGISPIEAAVLYVDKVAEAGIDCVKFQSYKAGSLASKNSPAYWDTTKESTPSQYELFCKFDSFGEEEYQKLSEHAHKLGIDFTSTPFDYISADYLGNMVDFYKISSSDITNIPFVRYIAKKEKPVYLSVGASYLSEIDEALRVLQSAGCEDIVLLHCVLSYPTKPEDANLRVIERLKQTYPDIRVGYSDHLAPDESMMTLTTAYMLGAEVIEKHFTLDKTLPGNDHYHAGDPEDFKKAIRNFEWIEMVEGEPQITVFPCEEIPRREARRSLVVTRDIKKGESLSEQDITAKRPGTGIGPDMMKTVIGRVAKEDITEDTILTWEMI